MTGKIDEAAYAEGRALFATGTSLKEIVTPILDAPDHPQQQWPDQKKKEDVMMSRLIGFADGLIDAIRVIGKRP